MNPPTLKVNVGMGVHLQLFVDATVAALKSGGEVTGLHREYVENISRIQSLAQECLDQLSADDPWRLVFETLADDAEELHQTLFKVPVLSHMHTLQRIADVYNRCIGVSRWHDFMLGGVEKQIVNIVKTCPLKPEIEARYQQVLLAVKRQVDYANGVRASRA